MSVRALGSQGLRESFLGVQTGRQILGRKAVEELNSDFHLPGGFKAEAAILAYSQLALGFTASLQRHWVHFVTSLAIKRKLPPPLGGHIAKLSQFHKIPGPFNFDSTQPYFDNQLAQMQFCPISLHVLFE